MQRLRADRLLKIASIIALLLAASAGMVGARARVSASSARTASHTPLTHALNPALQARIAAARNPIAAANALDPGTTDWQPTGDKFTVQAYVSPDSVVPGTTTSLFVSLTPPASRFDVFVYRLGYYGGAGGTLMATFTGISGSYQGLYEPGMSQPQDCPSCVTQETYQGTLTDITEADWTPSYMFGIPTTWLSGLYFVDVSPAGAGPAGGWSVPLVVRDAPGTNPTGANILFVYPDATAQAYNNWGGTSLYMDARGADGSSNPARAYAVSFDRPLSEASGLGTLIEGYDAARWLEQSGYNVTYTTELAVSEGLSNPGNYGAVVVAGHWEYVDAGERAALTAAFNGGNSLIVLSGNNMYWQTRYDSGTHGQHDSTIRCYKSAALDPVQGPTTTTAWRNYPVDQPEDQLLKELYQGAANPNNTNLDAVNTDTWAWSGSGIGDGPLQPPSAVIGTEGDEASPSSWNSADHITILAGTDFVDSGGTTHTVVALVDDLRSPVRHLLFDAGTIYFPFGLGDYTPPSVVLSEVTPVVPSFALQQLMSNVLARALGFHLAGHAGLSPHALG